VKLPENATRPDSTNVTAAIDGATKKTEPASNCTIEWPEVDSSRIVRPERFIKPAVSGLTVPVRLEMRDQLDGQSRVYLRFADGRREYRPLDEIIDLGESDRLFIQPKPGAPSGIVDYGWSVSARKSWIDGATVADPAELFANLSGQIASFIDFPIGREVGITATLSLWTLLTYVYHAWLAVPYLYVGGPAGSGKSRVFEVLSRLVFRPLVSSSLTGPSLFRTLNDRGGTLLLDEAERLRQGNDPGTSELVSMLLAGYKRGGQATRLELVGDSYRTLTFDVFGPKALACIDGLPPALASRCIPVVMFRAPPGSDKPRKRIDADPASWQRLRDDLHAIALEYGQKWLELAQRSDVCPATMSGRDYELWQPLLALAAWFESLGVEGLRKIVEDHALSTVESNRDDQTPDADETLLRILADKISENDQPTAGQILAEAQRLEPEVFKRWSASTVSRYLKRYGLQTRKSHGDRVFGLELQGTLENVQRSYGIDLGFEQ
jgi:hypothetical protein